MNSKQELHISVLGDSGVGKHCLIRRYCYGFFSDVYDPLLDGEDRKQCVISDTTCLLFIENPRSKFWLPDQHHREASRIAREADALVFVYDGTNPKPSIDVLRSVKEKLESQYHELSATSPPVAVVVTKADREAELGEGQWEEGLVLGRELAKEFGGSFFATSAVSGEGVDEAVEDLVSKVLKSRRGVLEREGAGEGESQSKAYRSSKTRMCCFHFGRF